MGVTGGGETFTCHRKEGLARSQRAHARDNTERAGARAKRKKKSLMVLVPVVVPVPAYCAMELGRIGAAVWVWVRFAVSCPVAARYGESRMLLRALH